MDPFLPLHYMSLSIHFFQYLYCMTFIMWFFWLLAYPSIIKAPENITEFFCPNTLQFNCTADGIPRPMLVWIWTDGADTELFEGTTRIGNLELTVTTASSPSARIVESTLVVADSTCDNHRITCRAFSELGIASSVAYGITNHRWWKQDSKFEVGEARSPQQRTHFWIPFP